MTVKIPLTQGKVALVDDNYAGLLSCRWRAQHNDDGSWYAVRSAYPEISEEIIFMHRQILSVPKNIHVRHKDRDGLNNQLSNLEKVPIGTKYQNRPCKPEETSQYKGVSLYKKNGKWRAAIRVNGRSTHIGYFWTEEEAAGAYDERAREVHGNLALLNFPMKNER